MEERAVRSALERIVQEADGQARLTVDVGGKTEGPAGPGPRGGGSTERRKDSACRVGADRGCRPGPEECSGGVGTARVFYREDRCA